MPLVIGLGRDVTASAAGRALFANSRLGKKSSNDADRLTKYLARFALRFEDVRLAGRAISTPIDECWTKIAHRCIRYIAVCKQPVQSLPALPIMSVPR